MTHQCWILLFLSLGVLQGLNGQGTRLDVSPEGPYQTIKAAIAGALDGDTIYIRKGVYQERGLVIRRRISLIGIGFPVIDAQGQGEILTVLADSILIEGIEFRNVGTSYLKDHAALRMRQNQHFTIRNNRIINGFFGIYLEKAKNGRIENNWITGEAVSEAASGNGIHAWYCEGLLIEGNMISGHRDGIYFEFVNNSRIQANKSVNNLRYGLHFMFSNTDEYRNNLFEANGAGVAVMFSKNINMLYNTFQNNWGRASYGLLLKEIYDARIEQNLFLENTIAINIEGSTRINYQKNEFRRNGWAIKMAGGCLDNQFTHNNFITNTLDLVLNSNVNNNRFDQNFWSEYSGYDLDRDGYGDVVHRPVKLFAFILNRSPESVVLLRSFFVDLVNFSERIAPLFTPAEVLDNQPLMERVSW